MKDVQSVKTWLLQVRPKDSFGEQRVFLEYGNGTKTTYDYEPERRRLHNMTAQTKAKRLFMDNTYDKVNNILSFGNKAPVPSKV